MCSMSCIETDLLLINVIHSTNVLVQVTTCCLYRLMKLNIILLDSLLAQEPVLLMFVSGIIMISICKRLVFSLEH